MTARRLQPTAADRRRARFEASNERAVTRIAERQAANAAAAERARANGWCELDGTPAQVAWAESIRLRTVESASERIVDALSADVLDAMLSVDDAAWWIDHRNGIRLPVPERDGMPFHFETVDLFAVLVLAASIAAGTPAESERAA